MKVTTADFDALADDLVAALDERKIPEAEKKELLDLLGTMKKDIAELP
jgi:hemoglobin